MATSSKMPDIEALELSDPDADDVFASPSRSNKKAHVDENGRDAEAPNPMASHKTWNGESQYDNEEAREILLRKELESVRNINQVMEGVVDSLERAKGNMEVTWSFYLLSIRKLTSPPGQTVSRTVTSASTLLDTWIRILSQTEHNQRLILNPSWHGVSQDAADIESESILQQQAAERRQAEEARRREAAARKAEDEERRQTMGGATRTVRGSRGTGRGYGRGTGIPPPQYKGISGQGGLRGTGRGDDTVLGRAASGIGRGVSSRRARGKRVL